jgi:hypothetical protein
MTRLTVKGAAHVAAEALRAHTPATHRMDRNDEQSAGAVWNLPFGCGARVDVMITFVPHLSAGPMPTRFVPRVTLSASLAEEASDALALLNFMTTIAAGVQQVERLLNARDFRIEER